MSTESHTSDNSSITTYRGACLDGDGNYYSWRQHGSDGDAWVNLRPEDAPFQNLPERLARIMAENGVTLS